MASSKLGYVRILLLCIVLIICVNVCVAQSESVSRNLLQAPTAEDLAKLKAQVDELTKQVQQKQTEADAAKKKAEELEKKSSTSSVGSAPASSTAAADELKALKDKLASLEKELADLKATKSNIESEKTKLVDEKNKIQTDLTNKQNELNNKQNELNQKNDEVNRKNNELNEKNSAFQKLETEKKDVESKYKELQEKYKVVKETLEAAEAIIKDPSVYDWFEKQVEKAMKQFPELGPLLNQSMYYVGNQAYSAFHTTKGTIHTKLSRYPAVARHASILSEVIAYIIFAVPLIACCSCIFSGRIRVNVHHLCVFGNVFFMGFSSTLFILAIGMPAGSPRDPLARISHDRGIYISVAVVYCGLLMCQLYSMFKSCFALGGSRFDCSGLMQLLTIIITGGHYFAQVWFCAMKNIEARIRSPWWYFVYAIVFCLMSVLSFRRLTWQQQNELRRLLFSEQPLSSITTKSDEKEEGERLVKHSGAGIGGDEITDDDAEKADNKHL